MIFLSLSNLIEKENTKVGGAVHCQSVSSEHCQNKKFLPEARLCLVVCRWPVVLIQVFWVLQRLETMAGVLFEDIFNVKDIDPEGKKFDRGKYPKKTVRLGDVVWLCEVMSFCFGATCYCVAFRFRLFSGKRVSVLLYCH